MMRASSRLVSPGAVAMLKARRLGWNTSLSPMMRSSIVTRKLP